VQDDYRVTSKFTLNYGLHYDIFGWVDDRHNNNSVFDFNLPNPADPIRMGGIRYVATPAHPATRAYPADLTDFAPRLNFAYTPFADRKTVIRGGVDIIYTDGNTQANGINVGASEDPGYDQFKTWNGDVTGQGLVGTGVVPAWILSQGAPTLPGFIDPKIGNQQFLGPGHRELFVIKNAPDPSVYLWNFQVERELPGNMVVNVGYVGSRGVHLIGDSNRNYNHVPVKDLLQYRSQLNQLVPMPADLAPYFGNSYFQSQLFLPMPQYVAGQVYNEFSDDGASKYNGLQAKVEKRFSHGLNFLAAYAYQKTTISANFGGYQSNVITGGGGLVSGRGRIAQVAGGFSITPPQDVDNRAEDRSLAPDDVTQVLNMSWTYELPFGPGKSFGNTATGIGRLLVQGWKISGSFNAQGGVPMQIPGPCNNLTCRVNGIGNPGAGRAGETRYQLEQQWYNPNAFQAVFGSDPAIINLATNGTPPQKDQFDEFWRFGTAGFRLGNARSPAFWGSDMALTKDFRITEAKVLQLRVEAYNVFNHQNLASPNTGWCLPPNSDGSTDAVHQFGCQFGRITNVATDPRALQFGLKFGF